MNEKPNSRTSLVGLTEPLHTLTLNILGEQSVCAAVDTDRLVVADGVNLCAKHDGCECQEENGLETQED